jgi:hypothetical protein
MTILLLRYYAGEVIVIGSTLLSKPTSRLINKDINDTLCERLHFITHT